MVCFIFKVFQTPLVSNSCKLTCNYYRYVKELGRGWISMESLCWRGVNMRAVTNYIIKQNTVWTGCFPRKLIERKIGVGFCSSTFVWVIIHCNTSTERMYRKRELSEIRIIWNVHWAYLGCLRNRYRDDQLRLIRIWSIRSALTNCWSTVRERKRILDWE